MCQSRAEPVVEGQVLRQTPPSEQKKAQALKTPVMLARGKALGVDKYSLFIEIIKSRSPTLIVSGWRSNRSLDW
jgi:hypothetical protein